MINSTAAPFLFFMITSRLLPGNSDSERAAALIFLKSGSPSWFNDYNSDNSVAISVAFFSSSIKSSFFKSGVWITMDHTVVFTYFTCSLIL